MAGKDQGLIDDAVCGEPVERRIEGLAEAFRQDARPRRVPERAMQGVMRDQSDLTGQAEVAELRPEANDLVPRG